MLVGCRVRASGRRNVTQFVGTSAEIVKLQTEAEGQQNEIPVLVPGPISDTRALNWYNPVRRMSAS